jgi:hypothetical protein
LFRVIFFSVGGWGLMNVIILNAQCHYALCNWSGHHFIILFRVNFFSVGGWGLMRVLGRIIFSEWGERKESLEQNFCSTWLVCLSLLSILTDLIKGWHTFETCDLYYEHKWRLWMRGNQLPGGSIDPRYVFTTII